ncbi:hypothetical protein ATY39_10120 [Rummeliibacillus stabekisii]|uniref:Uncharacterized protein n=1 Tax=Rummeliibacillus stabekisii TaxID=241244 RepID=A0A143HDF6_9BACL|nr:hypothetical protein ATY39_10120 [Rummeliibacillus stabekisii]
MEKVQRACALLGIIFIFLYVFYIGGYFTGDFFKYYTLVIGLSFLTIDLIIYVYLYITSKNEK